MTGRAIGMLPRTGVFNYYRADEGEVMEFRLIYQGELRSERCRTAAEILSGSDPSRRAEDKHRLRKHFHHQLRELWVQDVGLKEQAETYFVVVPPAPPNALSVQFPKVGQVLRPVVPHYVGAKRYIDLIADNHVRCNGNRFVPLVSEQGGFTCSLDILFLRRDAPGGVIGDGGDIDNRIKVLLDGLRMPIDVKELGGYQISPIDEDPFYCLLEDDRLITRISVTTDRLIVPKGPTEDVNDVMLVIHVTVVNPSALFAGGRLI